MTKGWFVTGASRGLGRVWSEAALERGDRVVATARDPRALDDLVARYPRTCLAVALDVTDPDAVDRAVGEAERFLPAAGARLDVVVNNAGYGLFGMVEEVTPDQARAQLETNLLGALWVTRRVLPTLRAQGGGHVLQVSSIGGVRAFPGLGLYHASKWALEGLSQSLAAEVAAFGIRVTLLEPTGYGTDWAFSSAVRAAPLPAYAAAHEAAAAARAKVAGNRGEPAATAAAVLALVDMADPPLRLFLGEGPHEAVRAEYAARLAEWDAHEELSRSAHRLPPG